MSDRTTLFPASTFDDPTLLALYRCAFWAVRIAGTTVYRVHVDYEHAHGVLHHQYETWFRVASSANAEDAIARARKAHARYLRHARLPLPRRLANDDGSLVPTPNGS